MWVRFPSGVAKAHQMTGQVAEMRAQLDSAIREERYEDAAALRDKIQRLSERGSTTEPRAVSFAKAPPLSADANPEAENSED